MGEIGLFEAIYTQRAIRKFKREAVPEGLVHKVIESATKAPSSLNSQPWRFLVVSDAASVKWVADQYRGVWTENRTKSTPYDMSTTRDEKVWNHAGEFATQGIYDVPCFIFVCSVAADAEVSVLQAAQNLMLAARGLGLGTVFTTLLARRWDEVRAKFGIPADVHIHCMIPIGYPSTGFGPTRRLPVEQVSFSQRWGRPFIGS